MAIPAIYGDLPEAAKAAYSNWMDALIERADHTLCCRDGCDLTHYACAAGKALDACQLQRWHEWRAELPEGARA